MSDATNPAKASLETTVATTGASGSDGPSEAASDFSLDSAQLDLRATLNNYKSKLKSGDLEHILAEKENLTPGLGADFTLNLEAGEYKIYCPGAKQDTWGFTVKGATTKAAWKSN